MSIKKLAIVFGATTILMASVFAGSYFIAINGEAYLAAATLIKENANVKKSIGDVHSTRLGFWGYSIKFQGPDGTARLHMSVNGEKGRGTIFLYLEKNTGKWKMIDGNLVLDEPKTNITISLMDSRF